MWHHLRLNIILWRRRRERSSQIWILIILYDHSLLVPAAAFLSRTKTDNRRRVLPNAAMKRKIATLCLYFSSNSCDFTLPEVWVLWNWKIKCSPDSEPDWFPRLYKWDKEAATREVNIWSVPSNHTNGFQVLGAQSIVAQQQQRKMQQILFSDNCSAVTNLQKTLHVQFSTFLQFIQFSIEPHCIAAGW